MKILIVKYGIISAVIAIALFLFITTKMQTCSRVHTATLIDEVALSIREKHIVDSMRSIQAVRDVAVMDSMNLIRSRERSMLKKEINTEKKKVMGLEEERESALAKYKKDTTQQSLLCDTLLAYDTKIIFGQKNIIKKLEMDTTLLFLSLTDANRKYDIEMENHKRTKELYSICTDNTNKLVEELKGKDTWWRRNEKWVYFVGGSALTIGTLKLANDIIK